MTSHVKENPEKITCPNCKTSALSSDFLGKINEIEGSKIQCINCSQSFLFIKCYYCIGKIFFSVPDDMSFIKCQTITCPYFTCNKQFYYTECPKCQIKDKLKRPYGPGEPIRCRNPTCKIFYINAICPFKDCKDQRSFLAPRPFYNFPDGVKREHQKKIVQIIGCYYCKKQVVFYSNSKYVEGQKVTCPYAECGKSFNRLICPKCYYENIFYGGYHGMGSLTKCLNIDCSCIFCKLICPDCGITNVMLNEEYKEGTFLICGVQRCRGKNLISSCPCCKRLNYFSKDEQCVQGRTILCGHQDCKKKYTKVWCPHCQQVQIFIARRIKKEITKNRNGKVITTQEERDEGKFSFGKGYTCSMRSCGKGYSFSICPGCQKIHIRKDKKEGLIISCKCGVSFVNLVCPFCQETVIVKNAKVKVGQKIICPNSDCRVPFGFVPCLNCDKLLYNKDPQTKILGELLKCTNEKCNTNWTFLICPGCSTKVVFEKIARPLNLDKNQTCPKCSISFCPRDGMKEEIFDGETLLMNILESKPILVGKEEKDENSYFIDELMIKARQNDGSSIYIRSGVTNSDSINKSISLDNGGSLTKNQLCIVCHKEKKEAAFIPCGHRHTCAACAVSFFESNQKCPRCSAKARGVIQKIYD